MAERTAAKAPDELAAAKARIAELEALDAERQRALGVQAALYRIADAASAPRTCRPSTGRSTRSSAS